MDYGKYILYWIVALLLLWLAGSMMGCTVVEWGPVKYSRLGGQELESMSVTRMENGDVLVELNKYKGEGMGEVAEGIARGVAEGLSPVK